MKTQITHLFYPCSGKEGNVEIAFVLETQGELTKEELFKIANILNQNFSGSIFSIETTIEKPLGFDVAYVGPNLKFETPESEKITKILNQSGCPSVLRVEKFYGNLILPENVENFSRKKVDPMLQALYPVLPLSLNNDTEPATTRIINLSTGGLGALQSINEELGFGMDEFIMKYYLDLFMNKYKRNPTDVELAQMAQGNSSHCRHWEFAGKYTIDGVEKDATLFRMLKSTHEVNPGGAILAFKDNGGVIRGKQSVIWSPDENGVYRKRVMVMNITDTAETHNHPSLFSPEPGAATGVGGHKRDISDIMSGSLIGCITIYYQTGKLFSGCNYPKNKANPDEVLRGAIRGASGYGNPFGDPTLVFRHQGVAFKIGGEFMETIKPIIYIGGIGSIPDKAKPKNHAQAGMVVLRIGGKTYRIGVGGGAASSMDAGANKEKLDFASVQRGEPMVARSAYNVIERCVLLLDKNPIESIHDQGAGGASNMLTELVYPAGATLDMKNMRIADPSMSQLEVWVAESQELHGILIRPENLELFQNICDEYECPYEVLGFIDDSGAIKVVDSRDDSVPVDLNLEDILGDLPQKTFTDVTVVRRFHKFNILNLTLEYLFGKVANLTGVCLPTYMVNTFDGSVGGRVVQGPRDGEYMLPVNQFGILSNGFRGTEGTVVTYAVSNPIAMQIDERASARMVVSNLLTTLMFVHIPGGISMVGGRLNEMWAFKQPGGKARLYNAIESITDTMKSIGLGINGGKDSTSMSTSFDGQIVKSFDTLVYQGEARMSDFRNYVTPSVRQSGSTLIFIDLAKGNMRMGGSALAEALGETGDIVPDLESVEDLQNCFSFIQKCILRRVISAGLAKEKGGLITTIAKMIVSSSCKNVRITLPTDLEHGQIKEFLFNEEAGIVVETKNVDNFIRKAKKFKLNAQVIGRVIKGPGKEMEIFHNERSISTICLDRELTSMSREIEDKICGVPSELLRKEESTTLPITDGFNLKHNPDEKVIKKSGRKYRVAVLSAPGTNGERELAWMFGSLGRQGFEVVNVPIRKIKNGVVSLADFDIIAFAGGFSYGDMLGSGKGWASIILNDESLSKKFKEYFANPTKLSFGVCNGFQVGTLLGIFDEDFLSINPLSKPRLTHNDSGRFEHRPVGLLIPENTNSIMFKGLGGSVLPAWSAHAEGKLTLGGESNYEQIMSLGLVAVHYADENGEHTSEYPMCPNGSPHGIAGLTTLDGRHTFMMPHIERVIASNHHLPYLPQDWKKFKNSIWLRAVENMYLWLEENKK